MHIWEVHWQLNISVLNILLQLSTIWLHAIVSEWAVNAIWELPRFLFMRTMHLSVFKSGLSVHHLFWLESYDWLLNLNVSGDVYVMHLVMNLFYVSQRCRWGSRCLTVVIFHPWPMLLLLSMVTRLCWHKAKQAAMACRSSASCTAQEHG